MHPNPSLRSVQALPARSLRALALALALFVGGAGAGVVAPAILDGTSPAAAGVHAAQECPAPVPAIEAEPWVRTELFFGTAKPDGTAVTDAEWRAFLDEEITARFPDGLTVMTGLGQYRDGEQIVQERSMLLILLYPRDGTNDSHQKIEEIRAAYEDRFDQSSVLRADDGLPVCTSF